MIGAIALCSILLSSAESDMMQDVTVALAAANEMEAQGAWDAAAAQLLLVIPLVQPPYSGELQLRLCEIRRHQSLAAARACYESLATHLVYSSEQALARYRLAALYADAGEDELALTQAHRLILEYPQSGGAERALILAWALLQKSPAAVRAHWVSEIVELGERAGVRRAQALLLLAQEQQKHHDKMAVLVTLKRAQAFAKGSPWADDIVFGRAQVLYDLHRLDEAAHVYEEFIEARQSSWFVGSYESQFYDDACLALMVIYLEQNKGGAAARVYRQLRRAEPTSRLLDDAARLIASHGIRP